MKNSRTDGSFRTAFPAGTVDRVLSCLGLHYQERFAEKGLTEAQRHRLTQEVGRVLEELAGRQQEES